MKKYVVALSVFSLFMNGTVVFAEEKKETPIVLNSDSAILYDMHDGKIVFEKNADKEYPLASLTKVMTMLVASEELKKGTIKLDDKVRISNKSWKTGGSRMFLEIGREVPVEDLLKGIAVVSGNDASVSIAEHIAITTDDYVKMMNDKAQELKMNNTHFITVNGLPPEDGTYDTSTANDLIKLTKTYLEKYPQNIENYHSVKKFAFDTGRGVIEQENRNPLLLSNYEGGDGLKTGFINNHYNFIGTAKRGNVRLIAIVLKAPNTKVREADTKKLLDYGFNQYTEIELGKKGDVVSSVKVYKAKDIRNTNVVLKNDIKLSIKKEDIENIKEEIDLGEKYVLGGKSKGEVVGKKNVYVGEKLIHSEDIILNEDIPVGDFWTKLFDSLAMAANWLFGKLGLS